MNDNFTESYDERAKRLKEPIPYKLFKGITGRFGALRFELKRPYTNEDGRKQEGCVFLNMAPTIGPNNYDWENQKVTLALNITDIQKILYVFRKPNAFSKNKPCQIIHDRFAGTARKGEEIKVLSIAPPSDDYTNYFFNMTQKEKNISISLPVSSEEIIGIGTLLQAAIPLILSWTNRE